MKNIIKVFAVLLLVSTMSSCNVAFLASKERYVKIEKDRLATLLLNDEKAVDHQGEYLFSIKNGSQQLKLEKEGYKDEYRVLMPYKKTGLYYTSYIVNTLFFGVPIGAFLGVVATGLVGPEVVVVTFATSVSTGTIFGKYSTYDLRLWNYPGYYDFNIPMVPVIVRDSSMKEVYLNKLSANITKNNFTTANQPIAKYSKKKEPKYTALNNNKNIEFESAVFAKAINDELKQNGFIDTSGLALKGSYKEKLFLDVNINGIKLLNVRHPKLDIGFTRIFIDSKWDVLDIYKNVIYSDTIVMESGEFITDNEEYFGKMLTDAMESGVNSLMNSDQFTEVNKIPETAQIESLSEIEIVAPSKFVSNLQEAIAASATIVTKSGHGSGFFVSEDGYLITNYHVVTDTTNLGIVLNDGSKCKGTLIQLNKDADLALLKIEKKGMLPFSLTETDPARLGRDIYVIGTPTAQDLSQTISRGIVSSVRKQANGSKIIQTDASVSRGNSGGPLVDKNGKLLGVVNAKIIGWGVEGISFAIPADQIVTNLKIQFK